MPNPMRSLRCAVCALVLGLILVPATTAQDIDCRTAFTDAEESYRNGLFDETIELLNTCLDQNAFSSEERRQAYRLIGLSYIGKDREEGAREAVRALLEVAPGYQADPVLDPPPFVALVDEMRDEYETQQTPPRSNPSATRASTLRGISVGFRGQGTRYNDDGGSLAGGGGTLTVGYGVTPSVTVALILDGSTLEDDVTLTNVGLGGRFYLGGGNRNFVPYVGAAAVLQQASIEIEGFSVDFSGGGGEIEGGLLYFFNPAFAVNAAVTGIFTSLSGDIEGVNDESFGATTVQFGVGISWYPSR